MGNVYFGVPRELALRLQAAHGIDTFVETGTYKGQTAVWAGANFKQVYTIEGWQEYYDRTSQANAAMENIEFVFGDSRKRLPEVLKRLDKPALIWLDAHYLGNSMVSAGTPGECPLLDELKAIKKNRMRHFILIDDLHCFQGHLNAGSVRELWPTVDKVHKAILEAFPDYFVIDHEDVIIGLPPEAKATFEDYAKYPSLRFIVPTSNAYVNVLNPFSYLFNKYIGHDYHVGVMRYDVRPPKLPPNFYKVAVGTQANYSWTGGLAAYLRRADTPAYFVLLLEDYFISYFVDMDKLKALLKYMQDNPSIVKIDLSGDRAKFTHKPYKKVSGIEMVESLQDAQFRASIQAALWRKDYLLKLCEKGEWNPWTFEKHAAQKDGALILGTKAPLIPYVNACGGEGKRPGRFDHKKIPAWMWDELVAARMVDSES